METYTVERLINADTEKTNARITVKDGRIAAVTTHPRGDRGPTAGCTAYAAVPGFIDIHTHGAEGCDVMDNRDTSLDTMTRAHLSHGTTTLLCSTLTAPLDRVEKTLRHVTAYRAANQAAAGAGRAAEIAGVHLEGPWISRRSIGAHKADYVAEPGDEAIDLIERYSDIIRMVTLSCHTAGSRRLLDLLKRLGIVAAAGHDEAVDDEVADAFTRGLTHLTHTYSNSASFQRRGGYKHLGSLELALMTPGVSVEVIADGKHITEWFWKFIRHNKSIEDIIVVSDSTLCAGLPENTGEVRRLLEVDVVIEDGVAWKADHTVFAGSVAMMHSMFRRLVREWHVPLKDAVRMTSWNPARKLGLQGSVGRIAPGMKADFVLLDEELRITDVVKSGWIVDR